MSLLGQAEAMGALRGRAPWEGAMQSQNGVHQWMTVISILLTLQSLQMTHFINRNLPHNLALSTSSLCNLSKLSRSFLLITLFVAVLGSSFTTSTRATCQNPRSALNNTIH